MNYKFNIIKCDIFTQLNKVDAVCVTTNGVVKRNGELVMGAGIAKQFAINFPQLPKLLGDKVSTHGNYVYHVGDYGCTAILSFPTKHNYNDNSCIELIKRSAIRLVKWANQSGAKSILIPSPGTGLGGLDKSLVYNVLNNILDERFTIVTK